MRIMVVEDNATTQKLLEALLVRMGHTVSVANDGLAAWNLLEHQAADTPRLAILDWEMPRMQGPDLCRRIRSADLKQQPYLILVTSRGGRDDLLAGLKAGADDYLTKPFDNAELQARVQAGIRIVEMQEDLLKKGKELEETKEKLAEARKLMPLCAGCKKLREDKSYWSEVEMYLVRQTGSRQGMGLCPACAAAG